MPFQFPKWATIRLTVAIAGLACLATYGGCGRSQLPTVAVHGAVSVGGQPVESGQVRFVPTEGTVGPISASEIVSGRYQVTARGGIPAGKHRVEIDAFKKTGRKVPGKPPFNEGTIDELQPVGAASYRGDSSPLVIDTSNTADGDFSFDIPPN